MEQQASYYDAVYKKMIAAPSVSDEWAAERVAAVLPHVVGSVFDLGCGLGEIANELGEYCGIDFSKTAIDYAVAHCRNPNAKFLHMSYTDLAGVKSMQYDTVLLLEILEHVQNVKQLAEIALQIAKRRIIITVPRDMPGRAHIRPRWTEGDLAAQFGRLDICRLFGGPNQDRWWLAVKDIK